MSKPAPKPEEAQEVTDAPPAATGSKKKKIIIISMIVAIMLAVGGGSAAFFLGGKKEPGSKKEAKKSAEKSAPAVFLPLDNFIVNLQSEAGDKYLQAGITMQVKNEEQVSFYKTNMPQLRSRILLLLSSKAADEILTNEGKLKLANEIIKQAQLPYNSDEPSKKEIEERRILGVFFTSFMVQ